jgi:hypothetical protein
VVLDQIEALAELNRIVARHGRSLDTVEPARRAAEPVLSVAANNSSSEPARSEPVRTETARAESIRTEPARPVTTTRIAEPTRPEPAAYAPPRSEPTFVPRRAEPTSPAGNGNRGWLTDLLNRASRDEDEPPAMRNNTREVPLRRDLPREPALPQAIESLDALSVDIARMVDHDAVVDLWDRYKRGERNVFSRRLYTLQGQKAFEEIRAKYRGNRDFKQTVDRYIVEFEQLLEDVSRDDRGQAVARSYLTSETGKVYTMLAHAAGRFE